MRSTVSTSRARGPLLVIGFLALFAVVGAVPRTGAAGAPGARALDFLVVGDWGRDGDFRQRDVAVQMDSTARARGVRFVISTGDNFYDNGVPSVDSDRWRKSLEDVYTGSGLAVPWYVVLGNHDYRGNPQAQIDYSRRSARWRMPARYFMRREKLPAGGSADLFFLDTNVFIEGYQKDAKYSDLAAQSAGGQLRWLEQGLKRSTADWRIVIGHHPVYSKGASHGDTPELIAQLKPLLDRYHVQMYVNGHDHDLQHIVVDGVDYVTSGAGSLTRPTNPRPGPRFTLGRTAGFVAFSLSRDSLRASYIDWRGAERYRSSRGRKAASTAPDTSPTR